MFPELIDVGDLWHPASYCIGSHTYPYCKFLYLAEGTLRIGETDGREIALQAGSVGCVPANVSHWSKYGSEDKHHVLWVGFDLSAIESRHLGWRIP